ELAIGRLDAEQDVHVGGDAAVGDVDRARATDADHLAVERDRRDDLRRELHAQRLLIRDREVEAVGIERDVDLATRAAAVAVLVAPLCSRPERVLRIAEATLRYAEATGELLIQDAGEDRRQLREALRRDSDLGAALDGLIRRQLAAR